MRLREYIPMVFFSPLFCSCSPLRSPPHSFLLGPYHVSRVVRHIGDIKTKATCFPLIFLTLEDICLMLASHLEKYEGKKKRKISVVRRAFMKEKMGRRREGKEWMQQESSGRTKTPDPGGTADRVPGLLDKFKDSRHPLQTYSLRTV